MLFILCVIIMKSFIKKNKNIKESKIIYDFICSLFNNAEEIVKIESRKLQKIIINEIIKSNKTDLNYKKLIKDYENKYSDLLPKTINMHSKLCNLDNFDCVLEKYLSRCNFKDELEIIIFKKQNNKFNIMFENTKIKNCEFNLSKDTKEKIQRINPEFIIDIDYKITETKNNIESYLNSKNIPFENHENFLTIDYKTESELIELFKDYPEKDINDENNVYSNEIILSEDDENFDWDGI